MSTGPAGSALRVHPSVVPFQWAALFIRVKDSRTTCVNPGPSEHFFVPSSKHLIPPKSEKALLDMTVVRAYK